MSSTSTTPASRWRVATWLPSTWSGSTSATTRCSARCGAAIGWTLRDRAPWRVSEGAEETWHVSDALRRRIVDDNQADLEFYDYGRTLVAERVGS